MEKYHENGNKLAHVLLQTASMMPISQKYNYTYLNIIP